MRKFDWNWGWIFQEIGKRVKKTIKMTPIAPSYNVVCLNKLESYVVIYVKFAEISKFLVYYRP